MKKIFLSIFSMIIIGSMIITFSCKKDPVKGCMDPDSKNYNSSAEEDDGSCEYEGSIVFWYDKATADSLELDGATALTYYVNGKIVGSSAASVYWTGAPNCDQSGSITVNMDLGGDKYKSYNYSVKDQDGIEYWTGTVTFTANSCTSTKLTF